MTKIKTAWFCSNCGAKQAKWTGQCAACDEWNSFQEEAIVQQTSSSKNRTVGFNQATKPIRLSEIQGQKQTRISSGFQELDKTLGGGIVPGSLILLGGDPGIGKSTLSLQVAEMVSKNLAPVLYISGEESLEQIALRAHRLGIKTEAEIFFSNTTEVNAIIRLIEEMKPQLVIVDSIQIIFLEEIPSSAGSVTQVRESTARLMHAAKSLEIAIIIIGHVTKTGEIAGPKVLEHLVDTVLYFEGDKAQNLRLVRVIKNRFGPLDEIAVFQMDVRGLIEIKNPSELFIQDRAKGASGSVIIPLMEGTRPILIETQALVTDTFFSNPSRRASGLDQNRMALLLAICEKRAKLKLHQSDVFVSITGGFKVSEPSADLGVILAIASSLKNRIVDPDTLVVGEVGLGGEVRGVSRIEGRIKEAIQMGFSKCLIPVKNRENALIAASKAEIEIIPIEWVEQAIDYALF
ncbi:MAG: DNA repair protein RadA [Chlamydia sp.]